MDKRAKKVEKSGGGLCYNAPAIEGRNSGVTTQILAVQRMQDYIEAHLDETIGMDALARAAAFSPRQAYRLFLAHTGLTPARYIRRLRLARSALRLKRGEGRVVDTAFELGFGSLDGYARAFAREFGMTPGEYRRAAC